MQLANGIVDPFSLNSFPLYLILALAAAWVVYHLMHRKADNFSSFGVLDYGSTTPSQEAESAGTAEINQRSGLSDAKLAQAAQMARDAGYGNSGLHGTKKLPAGSAKPSGLSSDYRDHSHVLDPWPHNGDRQGGWVNAGARGWVPAKKA